jgi:hypothetical protein
VAFEGARAGCRRQPEAPWNRSLDGVISRNECPRRADNSARWWRFSGVWSAFFTRNLMAGVLPVTSGDDYPSTPGPAQQSSRDRDGTIAGYLRSSNGGVALVVVSRAPGPRWRLHRRRVFRHARRLATALCLSFGRDLASPAPRACRPLSRLGLDRLRRARERRAASSARIQTQSRRRDRDRTWPGAARAGSHRAGAAATRLAGPTDRESVPAFPSRPTAVRALGRRRREVLIV